MAETATKTTTPRKRAAATPRATATKPAPRAAATKPAPKATPAVAEEVQRVQVTLGEMTEETKSFAKFNLKWDADGNDTGMVGTLYAPLGTRTVKILLVGEELEEAPVE